MNIAGPIFHRVVNAIIHQLDHRRIARCLLEVGNILDLPLDQREFFRLHIVHDLIDHEHIFAGQIGLNCSPDIMLRGSDHLHRITRQPLDFLDEKNIGRLGNSNRQHALH